MHAERHDAELRLHNVRLRAAAAVRPGESVVDIGCGAGQTTREAGRAAAPGHVLGVDISAPAIKRARELTAAEGLDNVAYELADAQVHPLAAERYDVAISRFGAMFFADPAAAFANIARALRPGARLALLVWQARERNEWTVEIDAALGVDPDDGGPFSLGDPDATTRLLEGAGFVDIRFSDVREPVFYGPDVAAALAFVHGFRSTVQALANLEPAAAARAEKRLRETLAAHLRDDDGVVFDSRAWIVSARRG
jgi:SAM-dependent methyltransferase